MKSIPDFFFFYNFMHLTGLNCLRYEWTKNASEGWSAGEEWANQTEDCSWAFGLSLGPCYAWGCQNETSVCLGARASKKAH